MTLPVKACDLEMLLPQTQCRQCGFDGCAQYAAAISEGRAPINRCAPGGAAGIKKLARAAGLPVCELDPEFGRELPYSTARIRAQDCIGCALCAVIEQACTGCGLCICACPVNAVDMIESNRTWTEQDALAARERYLQAQQRRKRIKDAKTQSVQHDAAMRADILAAALQKASASSPKRN